MGRTFVLGGLMSAVLLFAAAARSDVGVGSDQPPPDDSPPTVVPAAIGPTDPGPASALWHYNHHDTWPCRGQPATAKCWQDAMKAQSDCKAECGKKPRTPQGPSCDSVMTGIDE